MNYNSSLSLTSLALAAIAAGSASAQPRVNGNSKGSLVVYPHVEVRWNAAGDTVIQDTFLHLSNDFPNPVDVKLFFLNGDPPLLAPAHWEDDPTGIDANVIDGLTEEAHWMGGYEIQQGDGGGDGGDRDHDGWNFSDNIIPDLAGNATTYWAASTGLPAGVSRWDILDAGPPPGRIDPDTGERFIRGFVVAFAINEALADEIRWNHLYGDATVVHYEEEFAWQYHAYAFDVVLPVANDMPTGTPGLLNLDGVEYDQSFAMLQLNFIAAGSTAYLGGTSNTLLTLMPMTIVFETGVPPVTTLVSFDIWNENEIKFTNLDQCVRCWSGLLLTQHQTPNHLLMTALHTDAGKARMDAKGSIFELCDAGLVVEDVSILGLATRFSGMGLVGAKNLVGLGVEDGLIEYTVSPPPPEGAYSKGGIGE